MHWKQLFLVICTIGVTSAYSQENNLRCKWVKTFEKPFVLDSLTVDSKSINIEGNNSNATIQYDLTGGKATIKNAGNIDSLKVCYRVFPINFTEKYQLRTLEDYDSSALFKELPAKSFQLQREELFSSDGLLKSGSISRSISLGNNQDVFVNSTLNLNLSGKLTDDLNILASITDQNVPFQPDGNTQQLQEFDNVFLKIYNDNLALTGGDLRLTQQHGYFLRYLKNVQGGIIETNYTLGDSLSANTSLGLSVAKGRFASIVLDISEGVLGPYKIPGPNNESLVIILANSEKVFLDGQLLQRGFNQDYVIDYNLGEITFTNRVLITRFSRVRIDYEFSDRDYSRSIIAANHSQQLTKSVDFFLSFYQEKDNRNRPLLFDLDQQGQLALSTAGDANNGALVSSIDSTGFIQELLLYKQIDTVDLDGSTQSILVFSQNPDSARFTASFTDLGEGSGNYVLEQTVANGRVYRWVSPVGGVMQGRFEPQRMLPAPDMRRLITAGTSAKLSAYETVSAEFGISNRDLNLYSPLDDNNNDGYAVKSKVISAGRKIFTEFELTAGLDFEFVNKDFNAIDRFRYIEFDRDWSFIQGNTSPRFNDHIYQAFIELKQDEANVMGYNITGRNRGDEIDGFQHVANFRKRFGQLSVNTSYFDLNTDFTGNNSSWKRFRGELGYKLGSIIPGYRYEIDRNRIKSIAADSVIASAMNFESHAFFLRTDDNVKSQLQIDYAWRKDRIPFEGALRDETNSNTLSVALNTEISKSQQLQLVFIYRNLENLNQPVNRNEETVSSRVDWRGSLWDKVVRNELTYSVSNGRELRREFVYLLVPVGQGTHTWRDLNDDGVQDLNEFFEAINPEEKTYIRVFTPTNEFITAFDNRLNYRLSVIFPTRWKSRGGMLSFLSRLSNNTNWNVNHKITDNDFAARLAPFFINIADEDLVSLNETFRTTFFYNRSNPKFGLNWGLVRRNRKQFLTAGFDQRTLSTYNIGVRSNLSRFYNLKLETSREQTQSGSDFLDGRNYTISAYTFRPEIAWQPNKSMRFSTNYEYIRKKNISSELNPEQATFNEIAVEVRVNKANASNLNAQFRLVNIDFTGTENTPLGYELLEALRPGTNLTWSLNYQKKLLAGLQINLTYEGRKSPALDVIHIGRVQVSALF